MITAVLEIHTAAHQANSVGDYWTKSTGSGKSASPFEAPNALPCGKLDLKDWKPYLDELNELIDTAKRPPDAGHAVESGSDLVVQLARLAELRDAGALTEQEFADAKARLIGGS